MSDQTITSITNARRIAFGPPDRLMCMGAIKYPWAIEVYEQMTANTWFEKTVPMNDDVLCYRTRLDPVRRRAYDLALAFVSNLDGIQFNNLVHNIGAVVTAPEVQLALTRQAAEEGVHVRAYQTMIEAVSLDPQSIYMAFQNDEVLALKNAYIMGQSDILKNEPNHENFARAVVANLLLEGVYFYAMFLVFYTLAREGLMTGSADMIKYIQRDEGGTHLRLFECIHHTHKLEEPWVYDDNFKADAKALFEKAVDLETGWGKHVIGKGWPGLTPDMMTNHIKTLANRRWVLMYPGEVLFPDAEDSVPWFDSYSAVNGSRENFFESKPTSYISSGLEWD